MQVKFFQFCKPPFRHQKLLALGLQTVPQRRFFRNALLSRVLRTSSVIFIEQKCGPHIEQK